MGTLINDIKAGIEARITIAASSYTKLAYEINIADNKFKGNSKGFAVKPAPANEVDSLLGAFTMDHEFQITYTDSYNHGAKSQIGDSLKSSKITELNDVILDTYKDLAINKSNIDASILLINNLSINEAEFIEEEKVIIINFTINIKYKVNK